MLPAAVRTLALPALVSRDAARLTTQSLLPAGAEAPPDRLDEAIAWLCRTHDATGRHGSSKGFSLLHGWFPAYPETTGYVIGTLLEYARAHRRPARSRPAGARDGRLGAPRSRSPTAGSWRAASDTVAAPLDRLQHRHGPARLGRPARARARRLRRAPAARAARFLDRRHCAADGTWDPARASTPASPTPTTRAWRGRCCAGRARSRAMSRRARRRAPPARLGVLAPARRTAGSTTASSSRARPEHARDRLHAARAAREPRARAATTAGSTPCRAHVRGARSASSRSSPACRPTTTSAGGPRRARVPDRDASQLGGVWLRLFQTDRRRALAQRGPEGRRAGRARARRPRTGRRSTARSPARSRSGAATRRCSTRTGRRSSSRTR